MSDDVLITPASRKIEFKDSGGNVDGTIQLDSSGNLVLTSSVGLLIGDLDADIHIGDGSNTVDMVFDFAGSIYSAANQNLTIGKKSLGGNDILIESPSPVRVTTASGYIDLGPANTGYAHIQTDRTRFYFNKPLIIDGGNTSGDAYLVSSYNTEDFVIATNNGTEDRITVKQATGNVGIGTTSPDDILHVKGTDAALLVEDAGSNSNPAVEIKNDAVHWKLQARGGDSDKFRIVEGSNTHAVIDTSGNVGIGTTSPAVPFHVAGGNNEAARFEGSGNDAFIKIQEPTGSESVVLGSTSGTGFVGSASNNNFAIRANNSNKMTITPAGKVGIGTESPDKLLHVVGSANDETVALFSTAGGTSGSVQGKVHVGLTHFSSDANPSVSFTAEEIDNGDYRANLLFNTRSATSDAAPAERMRITYDGQVGIGTNSPDTSLHVKGSGLQYLKLESTDDNAGVQVMSDSLDSWLIYSPDGTPDLRFFTDTGYSVSGDAADLVEVMTLDGTNHRVGIGDTSPNGVLHVYRNESATTVPLLKLHEDSVYADNPTLEVTTDRTDGAIPSISVSGGAVTVSGPNGWNTWEKETFMKHSYGTATGQGSGLINASHNGVGTLNSFTLPYDAKLRAVVVTYSFNTSTSSTTDQTWRFFHSGNPANVVSNFTFDVNNDMTNMHGNIYVYVSTGLDIQMDKNQTYSVRRESGTLDIQNAVRFDVWYTRHTGNF